jgi:hypothetical protein
VAARTKPAKPKKRVAAKKRLSKVKAGPRTGQPSLRSLLNELLKKSRRPMAAKELAEQVLASGYKTKSTNFLDVIWTGLGQMDNVENVPGKGWRLK